jgi:hypothetical protein
MATHDRVARACTNILDSCTCLCHFYDELRQKCACCRNCHECDYCIRQDIEINFSKMLKVGFTKRRARNISKNYITWKFDVARNYLMPVRTIKTTGRVKLYPHIPLSGCWSKRLDESRNQGLILFTKASLTSDRLLSPYLILYIKSSPYIDVLVSELIRKFPQYIDPKSINCPYN